MSVVDTLIRTTDLSLDYTPTYCPIPSSLLVLAPVNIKYQTLYSGVAKVFQIQNCPASTAMLATGLCHSLVLLCCCCSLKLMERCKSLLFGTETRDTNKGSPFGTVRYLLSTTVSSFLLLINPPFTQCNRPRDCQGVTEKSNVKNQITYIMPRTRMKSRLVP